MVCQNSFQNLIVRDKKAYQFYHFIKIFFAILPFHYIFFLWKIFFASFFELILHETKIKFFLWAKMRFQWKMVFFRQFWTKRQNTYWEQMIISRVMLSLKRASFKNFFTGDISKTISFSNFRELWNPEKFFFLENQYLIFFQKLENCMIMKFQKNCQKSKKKCILWIIRNAEVRNQIIRKKKQNSTLVILKGQVSKRTFVLWLFKPI